MKYFFEKELVVDINNGCYKNFNWLKFSSDEVIFYYDGPKIFILRDKEKTFIVYWMGLVNRFDHYLLIETTEEKIQKVKENLITLKHFLISENDVFLLIDHYDHFAIKDIEKESYTKIIEKIKDDVFLNYN